MTQHNPEHFERIERMRKELKDKSTWPENKDDIAALTWAWMRLSELRHVTTREESPGISPVV